MRYSEQLLNHFFEPKNVGIFSTHETGIGRGVVGSYENGSLIYFQIKIAQEKILEAKFKAYGTCPIIAACSYATEWVANKTLREAAELSSTHLMTALSIPELKIHCALLVEDAVKSAIKDYQNS